MNREATDYWERARKALATAETLASLDPDAAASRAYYAAFDAVCAWLATRGVTLTRHTAVEAAVHRDLVKAGLWAVELGADFSFVRGLRWQGDYGGSFHVDEATAREGVEAAARVVAAVEALLPSEAQPDPEKPT